MLRHLDVGVQRATKGLLIPGTYRGFWFSSPLEITGKKGKNGACIEKFKPASYYCTHSLGCMTFFPVRWRQWGPSEMARWIEVFAAEPV